MKYKYKTTKCMGKADKTEGERLSLYTNRKNY